MSDDEDADAEPAVTLGDSAVVEGIPLARVTSRLTWGMAASDLQDRVGDITIRTPDGPQELDEVIAATDLVYFETRQEFEDAVRSVVGVGPVPTGDTEE
ncbi:MAG: DUF5789 family protein [Halobacteriaceae archaeon]